MLSAKELLKKTVFIVEANSFEEHCLWAQHATESPYYPEYPKVKWEQVYGYLITVGKLDNRPVCITGSWVKIDGFYVMFWDATSQVVDYVQITKWLEDNFKGKCDNGTCRAESDAMNFGHCLSAIREFKKSKS